VRPVRLSASRIGAARAFGSSAYSAQLRTNESSINNNPGEHANASNCSPVGYECRRKQDRGRWEQIQLAFVTAVFCVQRRILLGNVALVAVAFGGWKTLTYRT
jgi:hypothetical protein